MEFVTAAVVIIAVMVAVIGIRQEKIMQRMTRFELFCDWFFSNVNFNEEDDDES